MGSHKRSAHQITKFDISNEEVAEFNKKFSDHLSYGYYSSRKKNGLLPKEWYERLTDIQNHMPDECELAMHEYQEYKRKYHSKISFGDYIKKRDESKLPPKWYRYLIDSLKRIPEDYEAAYAEYIEYNNQFHDNLFFFEYLDSKEHAKLPAEWYEFLIQLRKHVTMLEDAYYF